MGAPNTFASQGTPAGFTFPSPAPSAPRSVVDPDDVYGYGINGTQGDGGPDGDGTGGDQRTLVWGTTVEVREDGARFKRFLEFFELPNRPDVAHYHRALVECFERENYQLDLDCQHLEAYDPGLYKKLVSYPQ